MTDLREATVNDAAELSRKCLRRRLVPRADALCVHGVQLCGEDLPCVFQEGFVGERRTHDGVDDEPDQGDDERRDEDALSHCALNL